MRKKLPIILLMAGLFPLLTAGVLDQVFIVLGWNDLGMHCSNQDFSKLAILPPYNNLTVQVVQRGDAGNLPSVITTGYNVTYEVPGNTYSAGKTNFWTYVNTLFGVNPAPNIGLTGAGLTGNMTITDNYFHVEGIPVTPFPDSDLVNMHPYQLALMKFLDGNNNVLGQTQNVIPVSHEINCVSAGCHGSEQGIRNAHENVNGYSTTGAILCASCHADNALGTTGTPGTPNFSLAIHGKHGDETNNCYKCHPGNTTQCYRDVMHTAGITCQNCHGSVTQVAQSIQNGREPWLEEPSCSQSGCHASIYSPEPNKLYRQSKGHGDLYCSACHNSPHAIVPSEQPNDNLQNITYQGYAGKLEQCSVCHGLNPTSPGPHGALPSAIEPISSDMPATNAILNLFPNPSARESVHFVFQIRKGGDYKVCLYDMQGRQVLIFAHRNFSPGKYQMELNTSSLQKGVYFVRLAGLGYGEAKRMVIN